MEEKEISELKEKLKLIINDIIDYINKGKKSLTEEIFLQKISLEKEDFHDFHEIDFDLFDDYKKFYRHFFKFYININQFEENIEDLVNENFKKDNFIIFLKYLIKILDEYELSYNSVAFKINLSILFSFLRKKNVEETIESKDYFYLSIKELQKEFPNEEIKNQIETIWKEKYNVYKLRFLKQIKDLEIPKSQQDNTELIEQKDNLVIDFKKDNINENNIDTYITNNDNLIIAQLQYLIKKSGSNEKNLDDFKNILFKLDDFDEIVGLVMAIKEIGVDIDDIMNYYSLRNSINIKDLLNDMTGKLNDIINTDIFYDKLKSVLNSKSVKNYFQYKRKFAGLYDTIITDTDNCDVNLKSAYNEFMKHFCGDKNWFLNLIRYKNLPTGKRAFVNENLKIFLNPLYIHVTRINEENKKKAINDLKKILTSYLIIIIISYN